MISIIICSRSSQNLAAVTTSIEQSIGVPYEIIAIDNNQGQYGICEAYNLGAHKSKFDILCFMHEDIHFRTPEWGKEVISIFQDETIGAVGVAGSTYLPVAPCPWWESGERNLRAHILHTANGIREDKMYHNPHAESIADVVVVDGVWICARKKIWKQHPFDQTTFPEFHFYDVDFTTEIYKIARVCVSYNILIEHFSYGSVNDSWTKNALNYYKKRKNSFPLGKTSYSDSEIKDITIKGYISFIHRLKHLGATRKIIAKYVAKLFSLAPLHKDSLYHVRAFLTNS